MVKGLWTGSEGSEMKNGHWTGCPRTWVRDPDISFAGTTSVASRGEDRHSGSARAWYKVGRGWLDSLFYF